MSIYKYTAVTSLDRPALTNTTTKVVKNNLSARALLDIVYAEGPKKASNTSWQIDTFDGDSETVFFTSVYNDLKDHAEQLAGNIGVPASNFISPGTYKPYDTKAGYRTIIELTPAVPEKAEEFRKLVDEAKAMAEYNEKTAEDHSVHLQSKCDKPKDTQKDDIFGVKASVQKSTLAHVIVDSKKGVTIDGVPLKGVTNINLNIDPDGFTQVNLTLIAAS